MKIIFYKSLFDVGDKLTPTEKIVYSFLVSKSIPLIDSVFESDGVSIDTYSLYSELDNSPWIEMYNISIRKMAEALHITPQTVITSMRKLRVGRFIRGDNIYVSRQILEQGYFELHRIEDLTGQQLIFYSFIKYKSRKYGGCIDTFRSKLAEQFGVSPYSIKQYLAKLHKMGFVRRLEDGKLQIL